MARSKMMAVFVLLLLAVLVLSALPAATSFGCLQDCISQCSNDDNVATCAQMCSQACLPIIGSEGE
ncbi:hypothetical protein HPP92_012105 [Vanilla planifolia]|nr:hypothetical protein HPP92_012105 [Vanilla planifolia]